MIRRVQALIVTSLLIGSLLIGRLGAAAELSGYVIATSDYVYRGATQSDGHAALQAAVDINFSTGFFVGAWASSVDIPGPGDNHRQTEIRAYLGYLFDLSDRFSLILNTVAYRYPGSDGQLSYDNQEWSAALGIDDQYWVEYAYSADLYDLGIETHNIEIFAEWPFGDGYLLSAGLGHFQVDWPESVYANETLHWQLGITRSFGRLDVDLRYHEAQDPVWFASNDDRIGSRFALSVRLGF